MKRETELNVLLPSRELLVKLVGEDRPLGLRASKPKKKVLLEIFFDTPEGSLREQGMTCRLCQVEGELPAVVVTTGEGSEEGGVVSRTMMKASAVGTGIFETLRRESEAARQIQSVADPLRLRPQVALNIRRLQRTVRGGLFFRPIFQLFFDVVTVQVGGVAKSYQELHLQDLRPGGPEILDLVQVLRDRYHIFPDGLSTLQRGVHFLTAARQQLETVAAPVHMNVALVAISGNRIALAPSEHGLTIPTFRGAGEDAALALASDVTGAGNPSLTRLGSTEPGPDGAVLEVWTLATDSVEREGGSGVIWVPWHLLVEHTGRDGLTDPALRWALLYLTHSAIEEMYPSLTSLEGKLPPELEPESSSEGEPTHEQARPEHEALEDLYERLRFLEDADTPFTDRLEGVSDFSRALDEFFVRGPSMLTLPSAEEIQALGDSDALEDVEASVASRLDHICIGARGLTHRLRRVFRSDLSSELKDRGTRILQWSDLEDRQREAMSRHLQDELAPRLSPVVDETVDSLSLKGGTTRFVVALRREPIGDQTLLVVRTIPQSVPTFLRAPISRDLLPLEEVFTENGHLIFPNEDVDMPFLVRITRCGPTSSDEEDGAAEPSGIPGPAGAEPVAVPEPTGCDIGSALDVLRAGAGVIEQRQVGREVAHPSVTRVEVSSAMPWATRTALLQSLGADPSGGQGGLVRTDLFEVDGPVELRGLKEALARPEGSE